jgi:hypothetical protein
MKTVIKIPLLLTMILIPSIVWAGDIAKDSLDKLMSFSGLNKQVAQFPGMVRVGVEQARQQGSPIPDAEFVEVQRLIEGAFQPSEILSAIGKEIKSGISESEAKDLLDWYESGLGRRITKAEENASTPAAYQEMTKEAQSLLSDEKRVKFAKKIDSLVNATDMTMQLQEKIGVAVFTAISTVMNPDQQVNIGPFEAQLSAQEQQVRANIEQLVIVSFVYCYKDIDIGSIEKYIKFLERSSTRKFNDSVIKGMNHALNRSIDKMAKSLAVVFKKYREKVNK